LIISHQTVERVQRAANIQELIEELGVELKPVGKIFVGKCPFHTEATGSFTVSPKHQVYYCFGCRDGGDAIKVMMKTQRLSFHEAVMYLADRYGVEVPGGVNDKDRS